MLRPVTSLCAGLAHCRVKPQSKAFPSAAEQQMTQPSLSDVVTFDPEFLRTAEALRSALSQDLMTPLGHRGTTLQLTIWHCLRREVYNLLCTSDSAYRAEREALSSTAIPAIAELAGRLIRAFGLTPRTAASLSEIALLIPTRLTPAAWCRMHVANERQLAVAELHEIAAITAARITSRE